jgi:hypothetical protein
LIPAPSRYQLRQPPALHTARDCRRCSASLYFLVAAALASIVLAGQQAQAAQHMLDLSLDHEHHRGVAESGLRPEKQEEVREPGDSDPAEGFDARCPRVFQLGAAAPGHVQLGRRVDHPEASGEDEYVELVHHPVRRHDARRNDLADGVGKRSTFVR